MWQYTDFWHKRHPIKISYCNLFVNVKMKLLFYLLFVQQKRKHGQMVFLTSISAINTFLWLFVLIVQAGTP